MLIEVKETHPPKAGRKTGTVIAMDGQRYDIWPDKLAGIVVGCRYDIEVSEREYDGRKYYSIRKATPAPAAAPSPAPAPATNGEAEYVGRALHALILKGEVTLGNRRSLEDATQRLRAIWYNTSPELAHYRQAAE